MNPSYGGLLLVVTVAFAAPFVLGLFPKLRLPSVVLEIILGRNEGPPRSRIVVLVTRQRASRCALRGTAEPDQRPLYWQHSATPRHSPPLDGTKGRGRPWNKRSEARRPPLRRAGGVPVPWHSGPEDRRRRQELGPSSDLQTGSRRAYDPCR